MKKFVKNKELATFRVNQWLRIYTKIEMCEILKISRPTLDKRLKNHSWKVREIKIIIKDLPF